MQNILFSSGVLGNGVAIQVTGSTLFAPFEGRIEALPETGYEVTLHSPTGLKLWMQVGSHTQNLMGEKCQRLVGKGFNVKAGAPLMNINPVWLKAKGIEPVCLVMVRNTKRIRALVPAINKRVIALEDPLFELYL